jgi:hypothetical protein
MPALTRGRSDVVMSSCRHRREALAFAQILSTGSCDTFPCGVRKVAIKISMLTTNTIIGNSNWTHTTNPVLW